MKITPLEIRQKDFEKKLRGYDKDEVNAFLQSLSNEWERVIEENKELSIKLQQAEKEVAKLREVESSLYKTLKTAEDTGANVIEQANKAAELHMKETQMNAEGLLNESKNKARAMIEQAEVEARQIIEELQDAVKSIEENHRELENHRQMALQELKNLSVTLIEKVEQNTRETRAFRLDNYVKRVRQLAKESEERIKSEKTEVSPITKSVEAPKVEMEIKQPEPEIQPKPAPDKQENRPSPPKTEELRDRINQAKTSKVIEPVKEPEEEVKPVEKTGSDRPKPEPKETPKKEPEKVEMKKKPKEAAKEQKKGPGISKTVSFFDELDTNS